MATRPLARILAVLVALGLLATPVLAAKCESPPCNGGGGGDSGGSNTTEEMAFEVDIDWTGLLSDTGAFTTAVVCTRSYCEMEPVFVSGLMPTFELPPEFLQHWPVAEADACFGATNPDGSVTRPMYGFFMRQGDELINSGPGVDFKVHYQAWTKAGQSEPILYEILFRADCPGGCPFPPAVGDSVTFTEMWLNNNSYLGTLEGKNGQGKIAERCWCTPGNCGAIPGLDSVTVTRLP